MKKFIILIKFSGQNGIICSVWTNKRSGNSNGSNYLKTLVLLWQNSLLKNLGDQIQSNELISQQHSTHFEKRTLKVQPPLYHKSFMPLRLPKKPPIGSGHEKCDIVGQGFLPIAHVLEAYYHINKSTKNQRDIQSIVVVVVI